MNYSLRPWNTFGITSYASNLVYVKSVQQLLDVWRHAFRHDQPVLILGEGSNILFLENFSGTVIINRIMGITLREDKDMWYLHIGAGENWHQLVRFTLAQKMPGLENLAFIPGCVGSSPIQNIGAYGIELKQVCEYVDCIELATGELQRLTMKECNFGYRDSIFKHEYQGRVAIVTIGLRLRKIWQPVLSHEDLSSLNPIKITPKQVFDTISHIRATKLPDPKIYGNAGSFFKNPIINNNTFQVLLRKWPNAPYYPQIDGNVKLSARWLINKCRLESATVGGAAVYYRQALILINKNKATSKDVVQLARLIRQHVGKKFNVWLEPEVHFIGKTGAINAVEAIS